MQTVPKSAITSSPIALRSDSPPEFRVCGAVISVIKSGKLTREDVIELSKRAHREELMMDLIDVDLSGLKLGGINFKRALVNRTNLSLADIREAENLGDAIGLSETKFFGTMVTEAQRDVILRANPKFCYTPASEYDKSA